MQPPAARRFRALTVAVLFLLSLGAESAGAHPHHAPPSRTTEHCDPHGPTPGSDAAQGADPAPEHGGTAADPCSCIFTCSTGVGIALDAALSARGPATDPDVAVRSVDPEPVRDRRLPPHFLPHANAPPAHG